MTAMLPASIQQDKPAKRVIEKGNTAIIIKLYRCYHNVFTAI